MPSQKVLLPYNFTIYDQKALDFVVRTFGHLKEVEIILFHTYTPVPEIDTNESPIMDKLKGSLNYLSQKIQDKEIGLRVAKQNLIENGFLESQVRYIFKPRSKDVAGEIIDFVSSGQADLIVINRKPGKVTRLFTGSVFNRLASALKNVTICLVT